MCIANLSHRRSWDFVKHYLVLQFPPLPGGEAADVPPQSPSPEGPAKFGGVAQLDNLIDEAFRCLVSIKENSDHDGESKDLIEVCWPSYCHKSNCFPKHSFLFYSWSVDRWSRISSSTFHIRWFICWRTHPRVVHDFKSMLSSLSSTFLFE